jgi:hypothetical protein
MQSTVLFLQTAQTKFLDIYWLNWIIPIPWQFHVLDRDLSGLLNLLLTALLLTAYGYCIVTRVYVPTSLWGFTVLLPPRTITRTTLFSFCYITQRLTSFKFSPHWLLITCIVAVLSLYITNVIIVVPVHNCLRLDDPLVDLIPIFKLASDLC